MGLAVEILREKQTRKTFFPSGSLTGMHILKLICHFKLMNHGKAKEHDQ